jgi:hypothetical protein
MRILVFAVIAIPSFFTTMPAGALTRDQAREECRLLLSSYAGKRDGTRTGVSRSQKVKACVREKMRGGKRR